MSEPKREATFAEYRRFLGRYLRPRLPLVLALSATLFISIGLQLVNPQIMRSFVDGATAGAPNSLLTRLALIFIGVAVGQQVIGVLVVWITETLGWATTNAVRLDLAQHALGLDRSFHTAHTPGEMIERIDGDVMALSNFFSQFILQVFGNMLLVGGILVVLLREDWRISAALGVFVLLTGIVLLRLANIAVPAWEAERQASAGLFGFLEERLAGTEDIRSNNGRDYVLDRFYRLTRELMRKTLRAGLRMNILLNTTWILFAVGNAIAFIVSGYLYTTGAITLGTVYMIVYYTNMLNWPLERITQQIQDLQKAGASMIRIMGVQQLAGKIPGEHDFTPPAATRLAAGPLSVEFCNVTFSYNDSASDLSAPAPRPVTLPPTGVEMVAVPAGNGTEAGHNGAGPVQTAGAGPVSEGPSANDGTGYDQPTDKEMVLRNVSFCLPAGHIIGLLGRTGSGKTTLTRLLFRLYDPDDGLIRLGNRDAAPLDIRDLALQELRRGVGMVTQNIQLFHATIRENLTFFDASVPDERILQAIRDLGLWEWYETLPKGLDTELESGGSGLSAGEAQMLAFTRIFLRDPGLVILDEATSRLDPATEHLIERAVDKLIRDRTAIIVAHRLGTVQRADDIVILEDGRVVEYGARASLAARRDSRFARLLETGLEEVLA